MTSQPRATFAAIDLGASSGRVMLGSIVAHESGDRIELEEINRFHNGPVEVDGRLHWDILGLYREILTGLREAVRIVVTRGDTLTAIGIDSWAVDYGLLDRDGKLLANPTAYRDSRTDQVPEKVYAKVSPQQHYDINGLQTQPFNTEFQLVAELDEAKFDAAQTLLMIPDLINYWLTGLKRTEITNASTTGLVDVNTREWSGALIDRLAQHFPGYDRVAGLLAPIIEAGTVLGPLTAQVTTQLGLPAPIPVVAVGSHDTASAIVGVPAQNPRHAYISCGTWSLVGVELESPVLTEQSREANFTNELGVDNTVRYLANVMGLWVLSESLAVWQSQGKDVSLVELIAQAKKLDGFTTIVDVESTVFLAPGDMPGRIAQFAKDTGQPIPQTEAQVVRCIIDSLALAYRRAVRRAAELSGQPIEVIHMVGGGIQNELLCQLTADVSGLPVIAGPIEGAVLGNVLMQARAVGHPSAVGKNLVGLRELGARGVELKTYTPSGSITEQQIASAQRVLSN